MQIAPEEHALLSYTLLTWQVILNQALRDSAPYLRSEKERKNFYSLRPSYDRLRCYMLAHREIRRLDVGEVIFSCPYCGYLAKPAEITNAEILF